MADAELRDRNRVTSGDFFVDPLPGGHDVHLYSMIMHGLTDAMLLSPHPFGFRGDRVEGKLCMA